VQIDQVDQMALHPSFANSWPELKELLNNFVGPR